MSSSALAQNLIRGATIDDTDFQDPDPTFGTVPDDLSNQSGLIDNAIDRNPVTYTSGVTDFDTFVASNPLHDSSNPSANIYLPPFTETPRDPAIGYVDFDLGSSFVIDRIAFWNLGTSLQSAAVTDIDLLASNDNTFGTFTTLLDDQDVVVGGVSDGVSLETFGAHSLATASFDTSAVAARFYRVILNGNFIGPQIGFGEIMFGEAASAVPAPAAMPAALALMGLLGIRRRRVRA